MEFIRVKFSDEETKRKYNALPPDPNKDLNKQWAPYAWRTVRCLTKIEEGIDRLILAGLVDQNSHPNLASGLSTVFTFDQRLRIVQRLVKKNRLTIADSSRRYQLPRGTGTNEDAIPAIRIAMRYRNMLFHNGVFLWVAGNDTGYAESLWVEVPDGYKHPTVPLIYPADGQPGLMGLAHELAMGLPFYFGAPIFNVDDDVEVNCEEELQTAWAATQKSKDKDQQRAQKRFDDLIQQFCGTNA